MKKSFYVFTFILVFCSWSSIGAEDKNMTEPPQKSADALAIKVVIDGAWDALQKQDIDQFFQYCSKEWMLYTASGKKLTAKKLFDIHKAKIKNFKLVPSQMKRRISGNIGWVTYDSEMSGQINEKAWGGNFIFTNIFIKNNGKWQCIHMHESKSK